MQNPIEIKAKTLEEALIQASISLNCPIINLQYEVIQMPSKGFLNIGKKEAIILVGIKETKENSLKENSAKENHQNHIEEKNNQKHRKKKKSPLNPLKNP